jgi:imidazolonepropionase-like amidohydrolase
MRKTILKLLLCGVAVPLFAEIPSTYAIQNARVVTVSGQVLERGTVLIRDGLIQAVSGNVAVPKDAWSIEGRGLTVYPGLIDALSTWGIPEPTPTSTTSSTGRSSSRVVAAPVPSTTPETPAAPAKGPEDRPSTTSWIHAADLISPTDRKIEAARNAGFTTAVTFPMRGIFAGQGVVFDLAGERSGQMIVSPSAGLYLTLTTSPSIEFPSSLMGAIAYVRQVFLDAEQYKTAKELYGQNPSGLNRPPYDRALEGVLESPRILLPAERWVEVDRMIRLARDLKASAVLYGGHEAYRSADLLRTSKVPILVSLKWPERSRDTDPEKVDSMRVLEMRERAPSTPGVLAKAGVRFALYSGNPENPADTWKAVKRAITAGLSQADAVRALTLSPAEIYGVADRLGSIEAGKIANLVVTDGDLFQEKTRVRYVFVDGKKFVPGAEPVEERTR